MIEQLLQPTVQEFIRQHANDDEQSLLLKHKTIHGLPASLIAWQISGRRKSKSKIPLYYNTANMVYPPGVNLEQSSSEETAVFKASLLQRQLPAAKSLVDLSGGFGVDSFFFSKVAERVTYVEPNAELIEYAKHNHLQLGAENIRHVHSSAEEFLESLTSHVDCFYIDPSRRSASNKKIFKLNECEPNIISILPTIFAHADYLLVKAAPLLDLQEGLLDLNGVKQVWVVSVRNEVKELLFLCAKNHSDEPVVSAVNLESDHEPFTFKLSDERAAQAPVSDPLTYLYEPNASILKAGAFKVIAATYALGKIHPNTHLYTSNELINRFPGRIFKINTHLKADAKTVATHFPENKVNVITRNYPLSPDALKKKFKLRDGGERYLIGCSGEKQKFLLAAERLK